MLDSSDQLDRTVKTALNETRLLILGVQVLLGFQFQSFFQDGFSNLSQSSQWLCILGLALLVISIGLLIAPSMEHRMVEVGQSSERLVRATSFLTGLGLVPLTVSLGLASYVVVERHFGLTIGILGATLLTLIAAFAWFGLEMWVGPHTARSSRARSETPLSTKVEQVLTEARVIIPGAQALFGFQFIAMLTTGFDQLPETAKIVHAAALFLIAINVILLMTPASLHRLSFDGENSEAFLRMAAGFVIAAPFFLAAGIAAENYVVLQKISSSDVVAFAAAIASFCVLIGFWYVLPLGLRSRRHQPPLLTS